MSARHLAKDQPASFAFSKEGESQAKYWIAKYPKDKQRSAVIPLLWIAQKDNDGWVSEPAMRVIGDRLGMAYIRVLEVATFYTMFKLEPVGEHLIQVCGTTPCMLRGSGDLIKVCKSKIGAKNTVSADGKFTWEEVECLGACVNAPMVQISNASGDAYYEDLDAASMEKLLDDLAAGRKVKLGPQNSRKSSEPLGGALTLSDKSLFDGSRAKKIKIPNAPKGAAKAKAAKPTPKKTTLIADGKKAVAKAPAAKTVAKPVPAAKTSKPKLLKAARKGVADDLTRISGVGPKIEGVLHKLGVFHFDQIAVWKKAEVDWVDEQLKFKGRIGREKWIAQAKKLAKEAGK